MNARSRLEITLLFMFIANPMLMMAIANVPVDRSALGQQPTGSKRTHTADAKPDDSAAGDNQSESEDSENTSSSGPTDSQRGVEQVAENESVAEFMKQFEPRGVMSDGSEPTPAEMAVEQFDMHPGLEMELVANEPEVSQPLFLSWDSRGQLWVVQYRQYQFPAGLKVVKYDQHLRAIFDRVPEPPPEGPRGKDLITVFEYDSEQGRYHNPRNVIEGLNIATSVQVGHGGIWVLNPPYLLFYPDADGDSVPDGEPEVHLSGFGLQDTHSVANSLLWGPDGWLYGASGSTTTGTVSSQATRGVSFQGQCIWRYHPDTHIFEIYAEGGGNTFSLEIDSKGRVFSGTNGGGTRGFYYPQGSYSSKNWGKHGPLTNPYAFGYFEAMAFEGDSRRFPQAFCIYEGDLLGTDFRRNVIAPNAMQNLVWNSELRPHGSSFRTRDLENLSRSPDRWFRPVYAGVGPDGAIYMADWYDTRLSHVSPIDDWHKESGRVYRVVPEDQAARYDAGDLAQASASRLVGLFGHENRWVRRRAVLELIWREEDSQLERLCELVESRQSLEALWSVAGLEALTDERAERWLESPDPHIRRWVVRSLGDRHRGVPGMIELAKQESDVEVRSQLAATAKRLPTHLALPIIQGLLRHSEDLDDPHLPLMIWWALEAHAEQWEAVAELFGRPEVWQRPLVQEEIAGRLMRRYAARGTDEDWRRAIDLVSLAPDAEARNRLAVGLLQAYQGRSLASLPEELNSLLSEYRRSLGDSGLLVALRQDPPGTLDEALSIARDGSQPLGLRLEIVGELGAVAEGQAASSTRSEDARDAENSLQLSSEQTAQVRETLLALATGGDDPAVRRVAMVALRSFDDPEVASRLIGRFGSSISAEHELRDTACRTLATRPQWAMALVREVLQWRLKPEQIPRDVVQQLRAYREDASRDENSADTTEGVAQRLGAMVEEAFGEPVRLSSEEQAARIAQVKRIVSEGSGDPEAGEKVFRERCETCHQLFGKGAKIGPPLDAYDRGNPDFWWVAIVAPSAEIREGYQSYAALTTDGRVVTGMIEARDEDSVTIRGADNQQTVLRMADVERLQALDTSLMPTDGLKELSDQQIRDLYTYVSQGALR